jgi:hypothetical protein
MCITIWYMYPFYPMGVSLLLFRYPWAIFFPILVLLMGFYPTGTRVMGTHCHPFKPSSCSVPIFAALSLAPWWSTEDLSRAIRRLHPMVLAAPACGWRWDPGAWKVVLEGGAGVISRLCLWEAVDVGLGRNEEDPCLTLPHRYVPCRKR